MAGRGESRGSWEPRAIDSKSNLSNEYLGRMTLDLDGKERSVVVVDIKFSPYSIFARFNGYGHWPSTEQLCRFVMRKGWPEPDRVVATVRYELPGSVVYRLYVADE